MKTKAAARLHSSLAAAYCFSVSVAPFIAAL
jgi:hypothetical protein